jgi:hypothetical protein
MNQNEPKPSRNRDLDIPPRKGESIESPIPDRRKGEGDRNVPLPEEETYEGNPRDQQQKS